MKILAVDDSRSFRVVLRGIFTKLDHELTMAETGLEAWDLFQKEYFPVVVTDWHMPEMDGLILTRMIRAKPHDRYTYIIILTGHGGMENYLEGIRAGADDFLEKPPDPQQLAARLTVAERIVGVQNYTRQLEQYLSVCSYCKNVREGDSWVAIERYLSRRMGSASSHGICPDCWQSRVIPELAQLGISTDGGLRS